jgi:hypothetical protein
MVRRVFSDKQMRDGIRRGLTVKEMAALFGVSEQAIFNRARKLEVTLPSKGRCPELADLTDQQKADVKVLMLRAGYAQQEAIQLVIAPRIKIRGPK